MKLFELLLKVLQPTLNGCNVGKNFHSVNSGIPRQLPYNEKLAQKKTFAI